MYADLIDYIDSIRYFDETAGRLSMFRARAPALSIWERSTNSITHFLEWSDN
jgi:hypothetical protein